MTLGQEMRWAYSTMLPSPHGTVSSCIVMFRAVNTHNDNIVSLQQPLPVCGHAVVPGCWGHWQNSHQLCTVERSLLDQELRCFDSPTELPITCIKTFAVQNFIQYYANMPYRLPYKAMTL